MSATTYSSLAAYLAFWQALRKEHSQSAVLAEMNRTIEEVLGGDREHLGEEPADSTARRRRERAELKLRNELIARGVLAG